MTRKYRVLRNCYGFRNAYWEKGQIVEVGEKENPSKHFELIGKPDSVIGAPIAENEPQEQASEGQGKDIDTMPRKDLVSTAKEAGIQNAHAIGTQKLREALKELRTK